MALFTLLTLFSFHFGLSFRGQIECSVSVVMGLMASFTLPPLFTLPHLFTFSVSVLYLGLSNSHSLTSLFGILVHSSTILKLILQIQTLAASNAIAHSPLCLQCLVAATAVHSFLHSYCRCQYYSISLILLFC